LMGLATVSALSPLVGAVPFALMWVLATAWLDPAWSLPLRVRQNGAKDVRIRS